MIPMRQLMLRACALVVLAAFPAAGARAQTAAARADGPAAPAAPGTAPEGKTSGGLFALEEVERQLRAQREQIEQLRAAVKEQSRLINDLRSRVEGAEARVARVEKTADAVARQDGSMTFFGDMRFRYESFYGQQNVLPSGENP